MKSNLLLAAGVVVALLLGAFSLGFSLRQPAAPPLGATIGYQSAVGNQLTFNALNSLLQDVTAVRSSLGGVISASKTFSPGTLGTLQQATSSVSTVGAVAGDLVLVSGTSTDANSPLTYWGYVSGAGTTTVVVANTSSSAQTANNITVTVRVLPAGTFAAPAALLSSTSTTVN